jgi:hypothetical protein
MEIQSMELPITNELRSICKKIASEFRLDKKWTWNEDEYQTEHYCGGWTPDENGIFAFGMSYYAPDGGDYLFSMTMEIVLEIASGKNVMIPMERWKDSPIGPYDVDVGL